jgi:hypothetical protein
MRGSRGSRVACDETSVYGTQSPRCGGLENRVSFAIPRCARMADLTVAQGVEMMRRASASVPFVIVVLFAVTAGAGSVPRARAGEAAKRFGEAVLSPNGFSYWEFKGEVRERMKPLLSKRLLTYLNNVHSCVHDWTAHQPPQSTDKPPGVDCCVFSASADWLPTSFALQESSALPDGRRRVTIEYRFDSPHEHARWHVAVYVIREGNRYVVDDFEGGLDEPPSQRWLTVGEMTDCRDGAWVPPY